MWHELVSVGLNVDVILGGYARQPTFLTLPYADIRTGKKMKTLLWKPGRMAMGVIDFNLVRREPLMPTSKPVFLPANQCPPSSDSARLADMDDQLDNGAILSDGR